MTGVARIFVALLNEGVDAWRPVDATLVGGSVYRISGAPESAEEHWEFDRDELVRCEMRDFSDGSRGLAAVQRVAE